MTTHCTVCGHKPNRATPGDVQLASVTYWLVENVYPGIKKHVKHEEELCSMCITLLSVTIDNFIKAKKAKKTLAQGKPLM